MFVIKVPAKIFSTHAVTAEVEKNGLTPGASKQHKFETAEVLWQDAVPVVEHPEETDL